MGGAILGVVAVIVLLLGVAFAVGPIKGGRPPLLEAFFAFVAFFFLIFGLHIIFAPGNDDRALLGDLFASLALTFFWAMRNK